jgi:hypothetical protein
MNQIEYVQDIIKIHVKFQLCFFLLSSDARVMWDQKTGRSRGYGFVSFRNQQVCEYYELDTPAFNSVICLLLQINFFFFFAGCTECHK